MMRRQNKRSTGPSPQASAQLSGNATELVPTSNDPVVNTLWKVRLSVLFLPAELWSFWAVTKVLSFCLDC